MYDFMNTAPVVGITGYNTMAPNDQEAVIPTWQRRDPWLLLCMPVGGEAMVVVSMMAAPLTQTSPSTTLCSWLGMAQTRPRATTGWGGTAGGQAGARVAISGFRDRQPHSVALTPPLWTAQLVLGDQAMMNNTCVDSVEFSLMFPTHLVLTSS